MESSLRLLMAMIVMFLSSLCSGCATSLDGMRPEGEKGPDSRVVGKKNLRVSIESLDPVAFPGGGVRTIEAAFLLVVSPRGEAAFRAKVDGRIDALANSSRTGQFRPSGWMSTGRWTGSWERGPDADSAKLVFVDGESLTARLPGFDAPEEGSGNLPARLEMSCGILSFANEVSDSLVEEIKVRRKKSYMECSTRSFVGTALEEIAPRGIFVVGSREGVSMNVKATGRGSTVEIVPPEVGELWRSGGGHRGADWFTTK